MTIIFFGSDPWFSQPVLTALLEAGHEVAIVVTKQKNIVNRQSLIVNREEDISVSSLRGAFIGSRLSVSDIPDAIVLAAFGPPFLPAEVLSWPKYGCLNVHASLLPRWRGASPVFGAIANGDEETGVSIMKMTEEIDLGPVLGQERTVLSGRGPSSLENRESLTRRLGSLGGELIVETLRKLENGEIEEIKQPVESPTPYTHRLTKDSGRVDWTKPAEEIERFIRAVTPWPGAWTEVKFEIRPPAWTSFMRSRAGNLKFEIKEIKILKAHLEDPLASTINHQPLTIDLVQLPGKNPISWKAFLAGHPGAKLN